MRNTIIFSLYGGIKSYTLLHKKNNFDFHPSPFVSLFPSSFNLPFLFFSLPISLFLFSFFCASTFFSPPFSYLFIFSFLPSFFFSFFFSVAFKLYSQSFSFFYLFISLFSFIFVPSEKKSEGAGAMKKIKIFRKNPIYQA